MTLDEEFNQLPEWIRNAITASWNYPARTGNIPSNIDPEIWWKFTQQSVPVPQTDSPIITVKNNYVIMSCPTKNATIYYTENSETTVNTYSSPILLTDTIEFHVYATSLKKVKSNVINYTASPDLNYLCFTAKTSSTIKVQAAESIYMPVDLQYSFDKKTWTAWNLTKEGTIGRKSCKENETISLNAGEKLYIKGNNPNHKSCDEDGYATRFYLTGDLDISGNIESFISESLNVSNPNEYYLAYLFCYVNASISADNLIIPNPKAENAYAFLFAECSGITKAPKLLPALTLTKACYSGMFYGCTSLERIPNLPATVLVENCYASMFYGCTSIDYVPSDLLSSSITEKSGAHETYPPLQHMLHNIGASNIPTELSNIIISLGYQISDVYTYYNV